MAVNNTDFLRFSAYSIKDLITQKLSQDSKFTDQIYEGSNLAILIDIFSYMAQCLLYSLNNAAAESMFADTQIYENINRLVNFIGYSPRGCQPSNSLFTIDNGSRLYDGKIIPRYAKLDTGKVDSSGKKIYFSTIEDESIPVNMTSPQILFYNGEWKLYSTVFTSSGEEYQKFILNNLMSNTAQNKNIPWRMIDVYVETIENYVTTYTQYKCVTEGLFTDNNIENGTYIYSNDQSSAVFNLRLNETKTYEIQFGNGRTGLIPPKDSKIYIFYLDSNGLDENVILTPNEVATQITHSSASFGISQEMYNKIFSAQAKQDMEILASATFKNITKSSEAVAEEDVESIRRNAPEWFKTGNRLVTSDDYMYYVKNRFSDNILDVVCQNNWTYISTFYKWLYELGLNGQYVSMGSRSSSGQYYINQNKLIKYDYKYADASDSNNVYLWIKMRNDSDIYKTVIDREVQDIKMLTQELIQLKPLTVYFSPCAANEEEAIAYFKNNSQFDPNDESYIELTVDDSVLYTDADIASKVISMITEFFSENKCSLGQFVDYSILCQEIYTQLSIKKIRTVFKQNNEVVRVYNGLSFATWTSEFIDLGDDLNISTQSRTLEVFQFPALYKSASLGNKIKVIRKSVNVINTIQY